jgi:hypothetical protein
VVVRVVVVAGCVEVVVREVAVVDGGACVVVLVVVLVLVLVVLLLVVVDDVVVELVVVGLLVWAAVVRCSGGRSDAGEKLGTPEPFVPAMFVPPKIQSSTSPGLGTSLIAPSWL